MHQGSRLRPTLAGLALLAFTASARSEVPTPAASPAPAQADRPSTEAPARPRASIEAGPILQAIDKLAADVKGWGGTAGVAFVDVGTGETIAAREGHAAFNPASNAKLVTAAAALRLLGPGHRFVTGLYGKLDGDRVLELVLRGQGDPSLDAGNLWPMVRELVTAGVRRVGAIVVDQSYFDDRFVPPAFDEQPNEWAPFRAPVSAVALDENTVTLSVRAAEKGKDAQVRVDPLGFVDVVGTVRTTKKGDPEKITLELSPKGDRLVARVGGHLPENSRVVRVRRRLDDPRLVPGYALRTVLASAGIEVEGPVKLGGAKEKRLLASHRSRPLGELLALLGKDSDNFYAEMIFKAVGAEKKARPGTAEGAAEVITGYLKEIGAFEEGMVVKNGSGLFDANRITPLGTTSLLRAAYRDVTMGPEFLAHLAVGGVDGTLRGRFKNLGDRGIVRAKTGTLNAVAALSGYVLGPPGRAPIAFSIYVNGIPDKVGQARGSIDKVVEAAARALWKDR
ncbi:D-alanyl-D-alanine carboxypeptidase/D-alanyl-D-alanine endopeptidase [Polyangium jinanense]|uniref:D-alanyl-D-alanine carboxypeptidase/D-alanyl-D-alanine-endopeptidase n=1 Tax=Polyangium jinanense TaxID=2829994 RepID=A0A9X3X0H6_9BACT|nr:D-alanyl-D-alanine carboxypeptidase/D-alanyl-D-alanine-endopeptidase [Polyangium jinanense]MDC3953753.1 D-alanyl-D-alanine carboxypeptidase/D-alanyl-D-alanine-endopeptidase [Polyangium jinanense]MDC3979126.1 D-alanyl-D-alanine carboxypeptidase/D-alanyl-D-alanine-endopeptidase [Polyangium jinanense]